MGTIILSAIVAHTAWHWMIDRADRLAQFRFEWPVIDAALLAATLRVLMVIVLLAGLAWFARALIRDRAERRRNSTQPEPSAREETTV